MAVKLESELERGQCARTKAGHHRVAKGMKAWLAITILVHSKASICNTGFQEKRIIPETSYLHHHMIVAVPLKEVPGLA
jgi:hypothetical protein